MPDLFCGKVAVGGNNNSTHDSVTAPEVMEEMQRKYKS